MECNGVAVLFIDSYSEQIGLLTTWALPVLGLTLGAVTAVRFRATPFLDLTATYERSRIFSRLLAIAAALLIVSLMLSYWATNALTQAIPDICEHDFSKGPNSLDSEIYHSSLWLARAQYLSFVLALLLTAISVIFEKVKRTPQSSEAINRGEDQNG